MDNNKKPIYQINIGKRFNISEGKIEYDQSIPINEDQFKIIELFADTKKDKDLNTTYILNQCEFTVTHFRDLDSFMKELFVSMMRGDIEVVCPYKSWKE